jgi:hypothetical protein
VTYYVNGRAVKPRKVDIHDPWPEELWPYPEGSAVYYIATGCAVGNPRIGNGRVHWYNPALVGDFVLSAGHPILNVHAPKPYLGHEIVSLVHVAPYNRTGKHLIEARLEAYRAECPDFSSPCFEPAYQLGRGVPISSLDDYDIRKILRTRGFDITGSLTRNRFVAWMALESGGEVAAYLTKSGRLTTALGRRPCLCP